jgi:L-fuculose-phosphate aldolase
MANSIPVFKRQICAIGKNMWHRGYCAGNDGNISVRLPKDGVLATPTGISKGFMTPPMIVTVDMQGRQLGRSPYKCTSEILLHLALYRARPDLHAVVHAHIPCATAFACSGFTLPAGIYPEAELCLGAIPTVPYSKAGYAGLGQAAVRLLGSDTNAMLLGNHGAVTFGKTLTEAYYRLEMLEAYCQILLSLRQIGRIRKLTKSELADIAAEKRKMNP